jgi:glycosyltransferase involved in cell wall biosynthesis
MRIGVNLIPLRSGQMGGHEFYVRRLLKQLLMSDRRNQYFLFTAWWNDDSIDLPPGPSQKIMVVPKEDGAPIRSGLNRWLARYPSLETFPMLRRWGSSHPGDLHAWVRRLGLDLWFCPMTNLVPRHLSIPTVVTVADIQQEYYPEFFTHEELQARALMYGPSCQEATAVIAVSEFSKQCMIEQYSLVPDKVHCVYEAGVESVDEVANSPTADEVKRKYHLPPSYAFYPANMWPHKNHRLLFLALHRLRQMYGMSLSLVLTGDDLGQWGELEAVARHFHLHEDIHYLGYVPVDALPGLYRGAALLLYPSLFEGFGIPLVEAMTLGCPVAAANTTSIPEVVGDAALLFDPRQPDSIVSACCQLLTDDDLRQTMIERGRERAALFSWKRVADETLQVFGWARAQRIAVRPVAHIPGYRIEGVYRDGWAVRRVRLSLPYVPQMKALKIEAYSNHLSYPLALRMKVDGRQVQELSIASAGKFTFIGEILRSRRTTPEVRIELIAGKEFIPTAIEKTMDTRRLAYQIESLSLVCAYGPDIPLYCPPRAS